MSVSIKPMSVEEVGRPQEKVPSERTLRTRSIENDARAILSAIEEEGAAEVDYSEESNPVSYVNGLRAALDRLGRGDILIQKKRNAWGLVAWEPRPEDQARIVKRQEIGARLGALARTRRNPKPNPTPMATSRRRNRRAS